MPLAWVGLGVALGLMLGRAHPLPWGAVVLWLVAVAAASLLAHRASLRIGGALLLLAGALLGILRADAGLLDANAAFERHFDQTAEIVATIDGVPETVGARLRFTLNITSVNNADANGKAIAWANLDTAPLSDQPLSSLSHGDGVTLLATVEAPEAIGTFDYPEHLAARGVGAVLTVRRLIEVTPGGTSFMAVVHATRSRLAHVVQRHVPEPQASVVNALVLGLRGGVSPETNDDFRRSGLSHLLAVSGLHVGVLLMLALGASARLIGRNHLAYLLPPLALLWLYVLLAGAPPSAVRAGAMGTAYLLALATGRQAVPVNALGLTAAVVLLIAPSTLWDRGFQLSATAMAGVLFIGLPLATWAYERGARLSKPAAIAHTYLLAPIAVSVGAVIGGLPLTIYNFGTLPLLSIPATLIAMPLLPPLLVSAFLAGIIGLIAPPIATVPALIPTVFGGLLIAIAKGAAALPIATVEANISATWVWAAYAALALVAAIVHRHAWTGPATDLISLAWRGPPTKLATAAAIAALACLAATPWAAIAFDHSDGLLHAYFIDVGQGDATLIVTADGATVLIDGGHDPRQTINAIDDILGSRVRIDVAVITHPDADHANGVLELARRGRVRALLVGPAISPAAQAQRAELDALSKVVEVSAGTHLAIDDGTTIQILHPPSPPLLGTGAPENDNSVSLLVTFHDATALFTGDLEAPGEQFLVSASAPLDADVLQVGHHGATTSSTPSFLAAVTPIAAVVSVGEDNPYGHPSAGVLDLVDDYVGDALYLTSELGTVELTTDGARWFANP